MPVGITPGDLPRVTAFLARFLTMRTSDPYLHSFLFGGWYSFPPVLLFVLIVIRIRVSLPSSKALFLLGIFFFIVEVEIEVKVPLTQTQAQAGGGRGDGPIRCGGEE